MFAPGNARWVLMIYSFASALPAVIEDRKHHTREAKRLHSLASTVTTPAVKARVLEQAQEHAMLAGFTALVDAESA
jgi:hypothetical protein